MRAPVLVVVHLYQIVLSASRNCETTTCSCDDYAIRCYLICSHLLITS